MSPTTHNACLLLGSNLEPEHNIPRAVQLLKDQLTLLQASSVWESASVEPGYPDYLNMALLVATTLKPKQLTKQIIRPLEARMGRVRTKDKNASRTIDIDIILFDEAVIDPTLWQQAHRALPVSEIFPNYRSESGETLKAVASRLEESTPIRLRKDITIPEPSHS